MEVPLQSFRKRFTYDPVKDLLGKGGFGEVYKAYDNEDHLFVALKIAQGTTDDKYNLINEIKRFKKLNHPNIVKHIEAYEVTTGGTDIHGNPIIHHVGILEYADQGTLADLLKNGIPDYRIIEDLAKDIIDGLAYLHKNNIIHRDLKPTNILLFSEGDKLRAKITDFGIAKNTDATAVSTQLVGTVEYMAPEYFTTGHITPASDVWSLGVMLLEALTSTHPFGKTSQGASNEQIIANILNKDISTATAYLTEPLKKIIGDCLRREVVLRAQSAEVLKAELGNTTADVFGEKTQVIELKKLDAKTQSAEPNWKRWGKALFDFDVRDGRWKKVLIRESLLMVLVLFLVSNALSIYPFNNKGKMIGVSTYKVGSDIYDIPLEKEISFLKKYENAEKIDYGNWRDNQVFNLILLMSVIFLYILRPLLSINIPIAQAASQAPKWERWGKALFDFDMSNGRWKNIFLREILILAILIAIGTTLNSIGTIVILMLARYMVHLQIAVFKYNRAENETPKSNKIFFRDWKIYLIKSIVSGIILTGLFTLPLSRKYATGDSILWYLFPFLLGSFVWYFVKIFLPQDSDLLPGKDPLWEQKKPRYYAIAFFILNFMAQSGIYERKNFDLMYKLGSDQKYDYSTILVLSAVSSIIGLLLYWIYKNVISFILFLFGEVEND